jgi:hypothetical protein
VQLVQERERVIDALEQVLVVLDHLALHVDAGGRRVPLCATAGWSHCEPGTIQRYPKNLKVAEYLAMSFLLDLVDETVHRLGDVGKVAAKPLAVAPDLRASIRSLRERSMAFSAGSKTASMFSPSM